MIDSEGIEFHEGSWPLNILNLILNWKRGQHVFFSKRWAQERVLFIYVFWILGGMVKLHGNYILDEMYTQVIYTKAVDHDRQRCRERWVNNT